MPSPRFYTVQLILKPGADVTRPRRVDVTLLDAQRQGVLAAGTADFSLHDRALRLRTGLEVPADDFHQRFLEGESLGAEEGLAFGQLLFSQLFQTSEVLDLWERTLIRCGEATLRVELVLPRHGTGELADIPFELLADDQGFIFRRHLLIRTLAGLAGASVELAPRMTALVAWANPPGMSHPVSAELLSTHEKTIEQAAQRYDWRTLPPLRHASLRDLMERLDRDGPTDVVSLIAHGDSSGGVVYLCHPEVRNVAEPVAARDLARVFRRGGVKLALLWSCHAGRHHPAVGAVVEALVAAEHGNLAAVISSHAALRADGTALFLTRLMELLLSAGPAGFEHALIEARHAIPEEDLQWAAPVFYARPLRGQTVDVEALLHRRVTDVPDEQKRGVRRAPPLSPYFRGRDTEIARGLALLTHHRLVSILGMAGIGKTELALAIADAAARDAALNLDRVEWFPLDAIDGVEALRARMASAFDVVPDECRNDEALARAIGPRRVLLVLDNAESLLRGASQLRFQALLETILGNCAGVRALLTTRKRLGSVRTMPEQLLLLDRLDPTISEEVFAAAAGALLTAAERASPALRDLVVALDGHPLSLILVAGQVGQGLSLSRLLQRIEQDADAIVASELLDDDLTDVPDAMLRLKRLTSSLNLSFLPLRERDPRAAEIFTWLGNLPAGVQDIMLPEVFGEGAEEHAASLMRLHLLRQGADGRLGLLAPVRRYALARLTSTVSEARRAELLSKTLTALAVLLDAYRDLRGSPGTGRAMSQAAAEGANLAGAMAALKASDQALPERIAMLLAIAVCAWTDAMLYAGRASATVTICEAAERIVSGHAIPQARLLHSIGEVYFYVERLQEGERALRRALELLDGRQQEQAVANVRQHLALLLFQDDRFEEAEGEIRRALSAYSGLGDCIGEANAQLLLAKLHERGDRLEEAATSLDQVLSIYQGLEDRLGQANTLKAMADLEQRRAKLERAEALYAQTLALYQSMENHLGVALTLEMLGNLHARQDRYDEAFTDYERARVLSLEIGARRGAAGLLQARGDLRMRTGALAEAREDLTQALRIFEELGSRTGVATTLKLLGSLCTHTEHLAEGEGYLRPALVLFRELHDVSGEANLLLALASLCVRTERLDEAETLLIQAITLHREIQEPLGQANAHRGLGHLRQRQGRLAEALDAYQRSLIISRESNDKYGEMMAVVDLGELETLTSDLASAEEHLSRGFQLARELGNRIYEANALRCLATVFMSTGRFDLAESHCDAALVLIRALGMEIHEANLLLTRAMLHAQAFRWEQAEARIREALGLFERHTGQSGMASAMSLLAEIYVQTDRLPEAEERGDQALRMARRIRNPLVEAGVLETLATIYKRTRQLKRAEAAARAALDIYRELGFGRGQASSVEKLTEVLLQQGRLQEAKDLLDSNDSLRAALADTAGQADTHLHRGELFLAEGRFPEAEKEFERARTMYRDQGKRLGEANTILSEATLYLATARHSLAEQSICAALDLYEGIGDETSVARCEVILAQLYVDTGRLADSETHAHRALTLFEAYGGSLEVALCARLLVHVALAKKDWHGAFNWLLRARECYLGFGDDDAARDCVYQMVRSAFMAERPLRVVAIGADALKLLAKYPDAHERMLTLNAIANALRAVEHRAGWLAASILCLHEARRIGHPSVPQQEAAMRQAIEPEQAPMLDHLLHPRMEVGAETLLDQTLNDLVAELRKTQEQPYSRIERG